MTAEDVAILHGKTYALMLMRNPALLDDEDEQEHNVKADCVCMPVAAPKRRPNPNVPSVSDSGGRLGPPGSGMDHLDSSERGREEEFRTPEKERTWPGVAPAGKASAIVTPPPPPPPPLRPGSLTDERGRVRDSAHSFRPPPVPLRSGLQPPCTTNFNLAR